MLRPIKPYKKQQLNSLITNLVGPDGSSTGWIKILLHMLDIDNHEGQFNNCQIVAQEIYLQRAAMSMRMYVCVYKYRSQLKSDQELRYFRKYKR
jgi:hypothetical protein